MFRRRHRILSGVLACAVVAVILIRVFSDVPATSDVSVSECIQSDSRTCIRFPSVSGTNLIGETISLPEDLSGLTLVLLSFNEDQTTRTAAWLPLTQSLAAEYSGFAAYSMPTLGSVNALARTAITAGMTFAVPQDVHSMMVMLFLDDKQLFLDSLEITDLEAPQSFLLNDAGEVLWRVRGDYSEESAVSLRAILNQIQ